MTNYQCPVPKEQQPTNEYLELTNSSFYSLPKYIKKYFINLMIIWIITFLFFLIISSGSVYFQANFSHYFFLSLFSSLSIPLLLNIILFLGWNHIFKRLSSEKIEYEESGWYDGQTWNKPLPLREKEQLIAFAEVKPILKNLIQIITIILIIILSGILLFQYKQI
tara:strand:+ start:152 stop:646 length:495 start_codon:yes stop_codon:yes gene_type:complete